MKNLKQAYMDAAKATESARVRLAHVEAEYRCAEQNLQEAKRAENDALKAYASEVGIPLRLIALPNWEVPAAQEVA